MLELQAVLLQSGSASAGWTNSWPRAEYGPEDGPVDGMREVTPQPARVAPNAAKLAGFSLAITAFAVMVLSHEKSECVDVEVNPRVWGGHA